MQLKLRRLFGILKTAALQWDRHDVPRHGAALAYYTLFALAPLLVIVIGVGGLIFGPEAARGEVVRQFGGLIGTEGARAIQDLLVQADKPDTSTLATIIGSITFFVGATGAFASLQGALNSIWNVKAKPRPVVLVWLRQRILSFGLVVAIGFLLLVSLTVSALLGALGQYLHNRLPGGEVFWQAVNFVISSGFIIVLFALIYKVLPDVRLAWADVWVGAIVTSLVFTLGKTLIGVYLGHASIGSTYGAAGSVVIILIWVYYSAQVILFGAEVTQAWVKRVGTEEAGKPVPPVETDLAVRKRPSNSVR